MKRLLAVATLLAVVLFARPAGAPPPLQPFPAVVRPAAGTAPSNTRIWAFGADAPPLAQIGFAVTIDGAPVGVMLEAIGCCAIAATLQGAHSGAAEALVSGPGGNLSTQFTIGALADATPPLLTKADLLDGSGSKLIIGADGSDDVALAGFLARVGSEVRGSAPPGILLAATPDQDRCVAVSAVDLAGNESAPRTVCGMPLRADAGIADAGEKTTGSGCQCLTAPGGPSTLALLGLAWALGRRRRGAQSSPS